MLFLDTSSAPPKPSRPGPSRQLQRWPENQGGRMKRGGNVFIDLHMLMGVYEANIDDKYNPALKNYTHNNSCCCITLF